MEFGLSRGAVSRCGAIVAAGLVLVAAQACRSEERVRSEPVGTEPTADVTTTAVDTQAPATTVETATTEPTPTEPPVTEPPVTDPPVTDPPVTEPPPPTTGPTSPTAAILDELYWEVSNIDVAWVDAFACTVVFDPAGVPISYDPTTRTLTRHVREDGEFLQAVLPEEFGTVYLVAAGPDDVVYVNGVTRPGPEGDADLIAVALAPGDAGREVGRVVQGGNPGVDFDFVATPDGIVGTSWYDQGDRPSPDERIVMPWLDRESGAALPVAPEVSRVVIDAYEFHVTIDDRTWQLTGPATGFSPTGMPPLIPTFDGGFIARYGRSDSSEGAVIVRGYPDGTVDYWELPKVGELTPYVRLVMDPTGAVLIETPDRFVRAWPFGDPIDHRPAQLEFDATGVADVAPLNDALAALASPLGGDAIAVADAVVGPVSSPAELRTIRVVDGNDTASVVEVTTENLLDDSVYADRVTLVIAADLSEVLSASRAWSCQPNRGHQDFSTELCT